MEAFSTLVLNLVLVLAPVLIFAFATDSCSVILSLEFFIYLARSMLHALGNRFHHLSIPASLVPRTALRCAAVVATLLLFTVSPLE